MLIIVNYMSFVFIYLAKDLSKWLLVRRFFLTDHESGIENGTKVNRKQHQPLAKVFRYASEVSLKYNYFYFYFITKHFSLIYLF